MCVGRLTHSVTRFQTTSFLLCQCKFESPRLFQGRSFFHLTSINGTGCIVFSKRGGKFVPLTSQERFNYCCHSVVSLLKCPEATNWEEPLSFWLSAFFGVRMSSHRFLRQFQWIVLIQVSPISVIYLFFFQTSKAGNWTDGIFPRGSL